MSTISDAAVENMPAVPLTVEGSSVLHQMFRIEWAAWKALTEDEQLRILNEAGPVLRAMEGEKKTRSAFYSVLGHKGDLLFIHFRDSFEDLKEAELRLLQLTLSNFLKPVHSYLSIVELSLYESTLKTYASLAARGLQPHSPEWNAEIEQTLSRQKQAMSPRLYPEIPRSRYICFYPMDRRRGEKKNWYQLPMAERQRQMNEHGNIGRRYAGEVRQIISASIGFDDWEWGVDLFADEPLVFKKLIYEMRFDEVSAVYALFGSFYVGIRCPVTEFGRLLRGELPKLGA